MVRITISIRWIATPRDHVRFQSTEDILHWYVTRWHHCSQSGVQDLTVVLLECKQDTDMVPFLENVVDFMQRNWANQRFTTMMWEQTENVLDPCWKSHAARFVCLYCWANPNEVHLTCGHTCCKGCFSQLNNCGQCRTTITNRSNLKRKAPSETTFEVPAGFDFTCRTCKERKSWVSACGHVVCPCNVRCGVCSEAITEIRRIY